MALAAAVTVASVVRLGLQARHDEIEIMQLVGSPISFIRGPFIAEGVLQGGLGALIALAVLWAGFCGRGRLVGGRTGHHARGRLDSVPAGAAVRGAGGGRDGGGGRRGLRGRPACGVDADPD